MSLMRALRGVATGYLGARVDQMNALAKAKAEEIEVSDYDLIRTMWNKRLFGNDSYTNITLPRL